MAFNYHGYNEHDLDYPNLVSATISTINPRINSQSQSSSSSSLPPQPPSSSSILKHIEHDELSAYNKPSLEPYTFTVEKEVLERAKRREEERRQRKKVKEEMETTNNVGEDIELTLSEVERKAKADNSS